MYDDGAIHIEDDDQCYSCEYFLKGVSCPLLEALAVGVVKLQEDMVVQNCGFYKKFIRHLQIVPATTEEKAQDSDENTDLGRPSPGGRPRPPRRGKPSQ